MRLIFQEVDALAVLQLHKFSDERLLTGVSLNYRFRPVADRGWRCKQPCNVGGSHFAM